VCDQERLEAKHGNSRYQAWIQKQMNPSVREKGWLSRCIWEEGYTYKSFPVVFLFGTFFFDPPRQRKSTPLKARLSLISTCRRFFCCFSCADKEKQSALWRTTKQKVHFIDF